MSKYKVTLKKKLAAEETIEAKSADEAQNIAFEKWWDGEIELSDSGIPGDVDITVSDEVNDRDKSDTISIFWDDLTEEKKSEILAAFGENCNFDVFPITEIPVNNETEDER